MSGSPGAFAQVAIAVAQEKGLKTLAIAGTIADGILAGATQIADCFIGDLGNVDAGQFVGAQESGKLERITWVGLHPFAGSGGNEGWSGHETFQTERVEPAGDDKAAGTGFVGEAEDYLFAVVLA